MDGIDSAGLGRLQADVVNGVVEDFEARCLVQDAGSAGVVNGIVIDLDARSHHPDGGVVAAVVVHVVNHIIGDPAIGAVHQNAVAGAVRDGTVFHDAVSPVHVNARAGRHIPSMRQGD